jgi:iron complex outermembrane receptor protein
MYKTTLLRAAMNRALQAAAAAPLLGAVPGLAQQPGSAPEKIEKIEVTGSRTTVVPEESSVSVTIIGREELTKQLAASPDVGAALAKLVPGLSSTTGTISNFAQQLRGRNFTILIDGVPLSTPLRNVHRSLRSIDPNLIERVEVIRGATATYGDGAIGGLINFITRRVRGVEFDAGGEAGVRFQPHEATDSLGGRLAADVGGDRQGFDWMASVSFEKTQGEFDAHGDRIPPDPQLQGGLADSAIYDVFGRLGYRIDARQRLDFTASYYQNLQDTDYVTLNGDPGRRLTRAIEGILSPLEKEPGNKSTTVNLRYRNIDILGSSFAAQLFTQKFWTRFHWFNYAPLRPAGTIHPDQSVLESKKIGARLDIDTPLRFAQGSRVQWGLDYLRDDSLQYMESGLIWVPEMKQKAIGGFAQLESYLTENLIIRAGIRRDKIDVAVNDFTSITTGVSATGATLNYAATTGNVGLVFDVTRDHSIYGGFSQGFSLADLGNILRNWTAPTLAGLTPDAQKVDSYEIGWRGNWDNVKATVALFRSKSDLGATFVVVNNNTILVRSPEKIKGAEATIDARLTPNWLAGATLSYTEGEFDPTNTGAYIPLTGDRIGPTKFTFYVENQTTPAWVNRLQVYTLDDRKKFGDGRTATGAPIFARGPVEGFTTADLISTYQIDRKQKLSVSIENLFNKQYLPVYAQASNRVDTYSAAPGMTITIKYAMRF